MEPFNDCAALKAIKVRKNENDCSHNRRKNLEFAGSTERSSTASKGAGCRSICSHTQKVLHSTRAYCTYEYSVLFTRLKVPKVRYYDLRST